MPTCIFDTAVQFLTGHVEDCCQFTGLLEFFIVEHLQLYMYSQTLPARHSPVLHLNSDIINALLLLKPTQLERYDQLHCKIPSKLNPSMFSLHGSFTDRYGQMFQDATDQTSLCIDYRQTSRKQRSPSIPMSIPYETQAWISAEIA